MQMGELARAIQTFFMRDLALNEQKRRNARRAESVIYIGYEIDHGHVGRAGVQHAQQRRHAGEGGVPSFRTRAPGDARGRREIFR